MKVNQTGKIFLPVSHSADAQSSSRTQGCTIPEPHSWHPKPSHSSWPLSQTACSTHFKLHVLRATFSQLLALLVKNQLSFYFPRPTHSTCLQVLLPLPLPWSWGSFPISHLDHCNSVCSPSYNPVPYPSPIHSTAASPMDLPYSSDLAFSCLQF